jgi:hypothetical protein
MPDPNEFPELFDVLILAGDRVTPGTIKSIDGHDRVKEWDIKKADASTGASSTLRGNPLGEFEVTLELMKDLDSGIDDFEDWLKFEKWLSSLVDGPAPIAVSVYHPDLTTFTEVVVRSIGGVKRQPNGVGIVKIKFGEHKPPKPKPTKRTSSKGTAAGQDKPTKPDPNAEAKRELAGLVAQAKEP